MAETKDSAARLQAKANVEFARTHFNNGRAERAIEFADKALEADPTYLYAHVIKAAVLRGLGKPEETIIICDDVIAHDPSFALAYSIKGAALQSLGRLKEAEVAFEKARSIEPTNALVHYNFACFWATEGYPDACREHLARALELEPAFKTRAAVDPDLALLRDEGWFQELVAL